MATAALKLKQASAVLNVTPKALQNLVQFGVVKPQRAEGTYLFDPGTMLTAKVAFCLKESLGPSSLILTKLVDAFRASEEQLRAKNPRYITFTCRISSGEEPIKVGIPLRALEEEIQQGLGRVDQYADLPRGRKRADWKQEFIETVSEAAKDLGALSQDEILAAVRSSRNTRRKPEITVVAEN